MGLNGCRQKKENQRQMNDQKCDFDVANNWFSFGITASYNE